MESNLICGKKYAACICVLPLDHSEEVHKCNPELCGGSWKYNENGLEVPVTWPVSGEEVNFESFIRTLLNESSWGL